MNTSTSKPSGRRTFWPKALNGVTLAFLSTLLALPVQAALNVDNVPPQSGNGVPPNILFILDDSGSMAFTYMPDTTRRTDTIDISKSTYNRGALSYDPRKTYQAWMKADGTRMTGGRSVTAAYSDDTNAEDAVSLVGRDDATFFVPKVLSSDPQSLADYYRYQVGSGPALYRSELTNFSTRFNQGGISVGQNNYSGRYDFSVPANAVLLEVRIQGGNGDADLFVGDGFDPRVNNYTCASTGTGSNQSCVIHKPREGNWYVRLVGWAGSQTNIQLSAVTAGEANRTAVGGLAGGRSAAQELANIATWYSYHRTRMKVAKAGASDAFSQLGVPVRVGFRTIHDRDTFDIPVGSNDGIFSGSNRTTWYGNLHGAEAGGGTPLRRALDRAGQYYSDSSATGPYGGTTDEDGNQFACRQNFTILTTDGFWNDNATAVMNPVFAGPGNTDGTNGPAITGPEGRSFTYEAKAPYSDNQSDTLADVAMQYWKNDLRPTLDNIVPITAANPAFWQHMVTFGISIGASGELPAGQPLPGTPGGPASWPDVRFDIATGTAAVLARIDDLLHAAVNSRGEFIAASNADEFAEGLGAAISAITERTSSASNVAANSTALSNDTKLFQASYVSGQWTGEVRAFPVDATGIDEEPPLWRASEGIPGYSQRDVFTHNGTSGTTFPTSAQQTALAYGTYTGADVADYIKGRQAREERFQGGVFRNRTHVLGDIIHSSPVYVADSDTLFVGANDGMLHAFDADTGEEKFAYVPRSIDMARLRTLSQPSYPHYYFVDGPLIVSSKQQTPGKNILVGTLGRGGRGVFALDVTSPGSFGSADVEWDVSNIADLGHITGKPFIAKLNNGRTGVVIGNGFNSDSDEAVLLVLDIANGSVIARIPTDGSTSNGLSAPRGWDQDGNGTVDFVYGGDLQGNLWKFDLSASNSNSWGVALGTNQNPRPLFVATNDADERQPITGGVSIGIDPATYKRWVFFGTGKQLERDDPADRSVQSMYGIIDDGDRVADRDQSLVERTTSAVGTIAGRTVRSFESSSLDMPANKDGWFIDFTPPAPGTAEGERIVGDPAVVAQVLLFSSIIPDANPCLPGGGGFLNALNAFTGASVPQHFFDVDGDGQYSDDEVGGNPVGSVDPGVGMPTDGLLIEKIIGVGGSGGNTGSVGVNNPAASGRVSWRELVTD